MMLVSMLGSLLALSSCVTINIYFPAAEADKAANKIIDDVWDIKKGDETPATPAQPAQTK